MPDPMAKPLPEILQSARALGRVGLSVKRFLILYACVASPVDPPTLAGLCDAHGWKKPNTLNHIAALEREGFLERRARHPSGRRVDLVALPPAYALMDALSRAYGEDPSVSPHGEDPSVSPHGEDDEDDEDAADTAKPSRHPVDARNLFAPLSLNNDPIKPADYAARFRRDIADGYSPDMVARAARGYVLDLVALPIGTPSRDTALRQMTEFLEEIKR